MNRTKKIVLGSLASLAVAGVIGGAAMVAGPGQLSASLTPQTTSKSDVGSTATSSIGFKLHNNTAQRLEFQYVTGKVPAPPAGEVLPGDTVDYELPYTPIITQHSSGDVRYKMVAPDGSQDYTLDLHLDAVNTNKQTVTVYDSANNPVNAGQYLNAKIDGAEDSPSITLTDASNGWANSNPTITPGQNGWTQDEVSGVLKNAAQNMTYENVTTDTQAYSDPVVLARMWEPSGHGHLEASTGFETSVTNSWDTTYTGNVDIMGAVSAGVSHTVGYAVSTTHNFSTTAGTDIDPGYTGVIYGQYPVIKVTGDFNVKMGATAMFFKGSSFDYPDTKRPMTYVGGETLGDQRNNPDFAVAAGVNDLLPKTAKTTVLKVRKLDKGLNQ